MNQLFGTTRHLEPVHLNTLRVERTTYLFDRPVLSGCVHTLKDDLQGLLPLAIHHLLQSVEPVQVRLGVLPGLIVIVVRAALVRMSP